MLKCNLAVLLAERRLKITKVSNDTGISRTTLTSLANNYSQGIQLDTLNNLCSYLQITPSDFFCYVPFEFSVEATYTLDHTFYDVNIEIINSRRQCLSKILLSANVLIKNNFENVADISSDTQHITIELYIPKDSKDLLSISRYLQNLSPIFRQDLEKMIVSKISNYYKSESQIFTYSVLWSQDLT